MEEEEFLGGEGTRWLVTVARNSLTILLTFDEGRDQDSAAVVDHAASPETGQFPSPGSLVSLPPRSPLRSRSRGIQKLSRESNGSCFLLKVGQRQCLDDHRLSLSFSNNNFRIRSKFSSLMTHAFYYSIPTSIPRSLEKQVSLRFSSTALDVLDSLIRSQPFPPRNSDTQQRKIGRIPPRKEISRDEKKKRKTTDT